MEWKIIVVIRTHLLQRWEARPGNVGEVVMLVVVAYVEAERVEWSIVTIPVEEKTGMRK